MVTLPTDQRYTYHTPLTTPNQLESAQEISHQIISLLSTHSKTTTQTLAIAESLTGGLLTATLTSIPGASQVVRGGIITYATPLKHKLLGVEADVIVEDGVISPEVARQMARGVRSKTTCHGVPTTWGLSTTGVAGPTSQDDKPRGMVYIGIANGEHADALGPFHFEGERNEVREAAVLEALAQLRKKIMITPRL